MGGGSREKGGGGNEIHAPCACDKEGRICWLKTMIHST